LQKNPSRKASANLTDRNKTRLINQSKFHLMMGSWSLPETLGESRGKPHKKRKGAVKNEHKN
jgi:hypothetical protein